MFQEHITHYPHIIYYEGPFKDKTMFTKMYVVFQADCVYTFLRPIRPVLEPFNIVFLTMRVWTTAVSTF